MPGGLSNTSARVSLGAPDGLGLGLGLLMGWVGWLGVIGSRVEVCGGGFVVGFQHKGHAGEVPSGRLRRHRYGLPDGLRRDPAAGDYAVMFMMQYAVTVPLLNRREGMAEGRLHALR